MEEVGNKVPGLGRRVEIWRCGGWGFNVKFLMFAV